MCFLRTVLIKIVFLKPVIHVFFKKKIITAFKVQQLVGLWPYLQLKVNTIYKLHHTAYAIIYQIYHGKIMA